MESEKRTVDEDFVQKSEVTTSIEEITNDSCKAEISDSRCEDMENVNVTAISKQVETEQNESGNSTKVSQESQPGKVQMCITEDKVLEKEKIADTVGIISDQTNDQLELPTEEYLTNVPTVSEHKSETKNYVSISNNNDSETHKHLNNSDDEEGEITVNKNSLDEHPYKQLLLNFEPPKEQLLFIDNFEPCRTLALTELIEINTKIALEQLIHDLKQEKELGVDVEYSDHGYIALVCLIQISTKEKDYIIDAIELKEHVHLLSEVFTDPNIVKIFHSAYNDLKWLQEDFQLFVVNMFDTQRAMKRLGYNKLGLDEMLLCYNVQTDKKLQRADFRKRPLPPQYKDYARTDSHFLINIYWRLRNELIQANVLREVLNDCNDMCKKVYDKVQDPSYASIKAEIMKMHERQLTALEELNEWRHGVAKYVDVNPGVVLSKNNMKKLVLELLVDSNAIIQTCKSEYVERDIQSIVQILKKAKFNQQQCGSGYFKGNTNAPRNFGKKRKFDQTDFANVASIRGYNKKMRNTYDNRNKFGKKGSVFNRLDNVQSNKQHNPKNKNRRFY